MSKAIRLFMGGLPRDLTRHDLAELLGNFKKVRANIKQRAASRGKQRI